MVAVVAPAVVAVALLSATIASVASAAAPAAPAPAVAPTAPGASSAASPEPSPATEGGLRVIGRVHVSAACAPLIAHANAAITSVLHNDEALAVTLQSLRTIDYDGSPIARHNGLATLDRLAGDLTVGAIRGVRETERLRDLANASTDPTRRVELKAFADSLGGALWRQRTVARDLDGMIAYLRARQMRSTPELEQMNRVTNDPETVLGVWATATLPAFARAVTAAPPPDGFPASLNRMAAAAADDFAGRSVFIATDESAAAVHVDEAMSGC